MLKTSPLTGSDFRRCSLACSSDQKKTDFCQKSGMIFGAEKDSQSTWGDNI
jgi:hypothetical protein